jgi:nicotinamide phosphoribosyltransferase
VEITTETVRRLWNTFGGSVNTKGYKVLDPHIRVIYGDSITPQRAEDIYRILTEDGFACNNVFLAVGSFSMQCLEQDGKTKPYTRDTYGIAIKATYCEINGRAVPIFKDPKTDTGSFKKSQRGMCAVTRDSSGDLVCRDGFDSGSMAKYLGFGGENLLKPVFRDGKMLREQSLREIRNVLHGDF